MNDAKPPLSTRMRVLHVISGLYYGGGQRVVLDLFNWLPRAGQLDLSLCTLGTFTGSPLADRCHVVLPYNGRYNNPRVLIRAANQLRKLLAAQNIDLLHTHGTDADLIGALAAQCTRTRHVCHLHINRPGRRESWKAAVRRRLLSHLTRRNRASFIACSEAVRRQTGRYYHLPLDRVLTVRNGIDLAPFAAAQQRPDPPPEGRAVFGTAARLVPMKGLDHLLHAVAALRRQGLCFELRIAGTGGLQDYLARLARTLHVHQHVHFLGHVTEMPAFYRGLDVFVLPSLDEGLPLVVLEAMAAARAVVATHVGGTSEALRHSIDGLVVPPADLNALGEAMALLARDPAMRRRMALSGRQRVQDDFSIQRVAGEVIEVYKQALAGQKQVTQISNRLLKAVQS